MLKFWFPFFASWQEIHESCDTVPLPSPLRGPSSCAIQQYYVMQDRFRSLSNLLFSSLKIRQMLKKLWGYEVQPKITQI